MPSTAVAMPITASGNRPAVRAGKTSDNSGFVVPAFDLPPKFRFRRNDEPIDIALAGNRADCTTFLIRKNRSLA
jgi:hypothetical protein